VTSTANEGRDLGLVRDERDGPVARIVLNWPERANAQSSQMVAQVDGCLDEARRDYGVGWSSSRERQGILRWARDRPPTPIPSSPLHKKNLGSNYRGSKELLLWATLVSGSFPNR
jgi:enoyl-CoA hydratase